MMPRMLFVDDEPMVLNGLRRMLRGRRNEWDISFADSGKDALALLSDTPFDIIVSDMRMPEMTGDVLLREVAEAHPGCARLILSGHAELAAILDAVTPAHQFHAKPCDMTALDQSLSCILQALNGDLDTNVRERLIGTRHLLSGEKAFRDLSSHLEAATPDPEETLRIVSSDIAMTAHVLRLVNSAFFGKSMATLDLGQALGILGGDLLRRLLHESRLFSVADNENDESIVRILNDAAREDAEAVRQVAAAAGMTGEFVEQTGSAAVLSHVGFLASLEPDPRCASANRDRYAALLLALWGFDPDLIAAVTLSGATNDSRFDGIAELLRMTRARHEGTCP